MASYETYSNSLYNNTKENLVGEKLFKLAEVLKEKREKLKREFNEKNDSKFDFTPQIYENSRNMMKKYQQTPIYERYNEIVQNKKDYVNKLRIDQEKCEKVKFNNFNPKINQKSVDIARKHDISSDQILLNVNDRLYYKGLEKKKNMKKTAEEKEIEKCTFTPHLYSNKSQMFNHSQMLTNKDGFGNIDDFLCRQKIYEDIKRDKLERKMNKSSDNILKPFHPQINKTSDILVRADKERNCEDLEMKIDRLYRKNYNKIQDRKKNLEEFYYSQYYFKPKINEVSKFVGRDTRIDEISKKTESEKVKMYKNLEKEDSECTFQPKFFTNPNKFSNINSNYKIDDNTNFRIHEEMLNKKEKIQEIKKRVEEEESTELNFKPKINKGMPVFEFDEPLILKGFAKHIEKMEKAKKAKRDKEEREKEVFITGDNWNKDNLITIPKPFQLSYVNFLI